MKIAAVQRFSTVDYPGKVAAVFFTPGCNLDCFYCHNRWLLEPGADRYTMDMERILGWLQKRRGFVDAVVLTGGEPTLQAGLAGFITKIRDMGYSVKLDTNGTRPDVLNELIEQGLVDYVAMDVKAPPDKYDKVCGVRVDYNAIATSIDILLAGHVGYEFRTTLIPQLKRADVLAIANKLQGARLYVLQKYRRPDLPRGYYNPKLDATPYSPCQTMELLAQVKRTLPYCTMRSFGIDNQVSGTSSPPVLTQKVS